MFVQGQRSAMFLWQCSSKVVAMFLRLDAFKRMAGLDPSSRVFYHFARKFEALERQYAWTNG